jgi:hypothetical protein
MYRNGDATPFVIVLNISNKRENEMRCLGAKKTLLKI